MNVCATISRSDGSWPACRPIDTFVSFLVELRPYLAAVVGVLDSIGQQVDHDMLQSPVFRPPTR
jgi:hypothetical protein